MMWKEKLAGKISFEEVGQEVVGRITDIKPQMMLGGEVNSFTIVTEEGETMSFLGTVVLDRLLGHELNSLVKIKYLGTTKTAAGRPLKGFQVFVWGEEAELISKGDPVPAGKKKK